MRYKVIDLAWAAGFLEGEGCFQIGWAREGRNAPALVSAAQVDKAPLLKLQSLFGGSLHHEQHRNGNRSDTWNWNVSTGFCREILPLLIPYMHGNKQKQAEFLWQYAASLVPQHGVRLSDGEITRRRKAKEKLSGMKLRAGRL